MRGEYTLRQAKGCESIKVARLLLQSLNQGIEGEFGVRTDRLHDHVLRNINSCNGFSLVMLKDNEIVGCFMGELKEHIYCNGYIASELGCFISEEHRGGHVFEDMLQEFINWADLKPKVLMKTFSIGQLGRTTPYLRSVLKKHGFIQGDEGYYLK